MEKIKPETQRAIDAAAEQASLESATRVQYLLKPALKAAIKELYAEFWRDIGLYLLRARWVRIALGAGALATAIWEAVEKYLK